MKPSLLNLLGRSQFQISQRNVLIDSIVACETDSSHQALYDQIVTNDSGFVEKYLQSAIFCCQSPSVARNISWNLTRLLQQYKTGFLTLESMVTQYNSSGLRDWLMEELKKCPAGDHGCQIAYFNVLSKLPNSQELILDHVQNCSNSPRLCLLSVKIMEMSPSSVHMFDRLFHSSHHSNIIRLTALERILASPKFHSATMDHLLRVIFLEANQNVEFSLFAFKLIAAKAQDNQVLK